MLIFFFYLKYLFLGAAISDGGIEGGVMSYINRSHWLVIVFVGVIATSLACVIFVIGLVVIRRWVLED